MFSTIHRYLCNIYYWISGKDKCVIKGHLVRLSANLRPGPGNLKKDLAYIKQRQKKRL